MLNIELVDPKDLLTWDKNPRERNPERFEWLKTSLQKFGFVMPIYVRESDSTLYSGHQRTGAAIAIGFEKVPIVHIPSPGERMERTVNILFNLCTNDHATKANFGKGAALHLQDLEQFQSFPDIGDRYPCLKSFAITPIAYMDQLSALTVNAMTKEFADNLHSYGIQIPIILDENDQILNGRARLLSAIGLNLVSYPAVRVTENTEALKLFLNKITMSFDLKQAFGEELRYNSFFRRTNQRIQRQILAGGFYHWVFGKEAIKGGKAWTRQHLTKLEGEFLKRFIEEHGTVCIDFGAGRLDNTVKLQAAGITCIPFEPYTLKPGTNNICRSSARMLTTRFLAWLEKRPHIDSLFCCYVFNSVPFEQDRYYLMVIFQAICMWGARLYLYALSDDGMASAFFNNAANETGRRSKTILLDSEPGLYIALQGASKVQKRHSKGELMAQGFRHFNRVKYHSDGGGHGTKCEGPKPIDWVELVKALEFEFNLPYPGGERLGMVDEAISAFSKFTGQNLAEIRVQAQISELGETTIEAEVAIDETNPSPES